MKEQVPVGLSNRHCHLTTEHFELLFGKEHTMTPIKNLSQPGQFACEECIDIKGPKGIVPKIRILGPARAETQVEILAADSYKLGVPSVIRHSGDLDGTPGIELIGPNGSLTVEKGVIVAARHLHLSVEQAKEYNLKDGDVISVEAAGERGVVFNNVLVRSGEKHYLDLHIDTEEGNAAGLKNGDLVKIVARPEE